MSAVAYFLGGPLDLTKRVLLDTDAYRVVSLNSGEHMYAVEPVYISGQDKRQHFVFVYQGERRRA